MDVKKSDGEEGMGTAVALARAPAIGRFRRLRSIGSGGMADVFEALDESTGEHVALKLLRVPEGDDRRDFRYGLFEREYHALSQLAHPRVVTAHQYGVSEEGPYYTMELLDGADLMELAPMPWRQACVVLRDVCAVLSLLHSRRMLYRDLNPRNVRCTSDGIGKLIDFGALMPMGSPRKVVGMPAFVAPELVNRQLSDGRADLFGIGTTLYFALTGQRPFPARAFEELPLFWRSAPRPPSSFAPDVPPALDALVMDLMRIDVALRPASAGDVIDRLEAIAGLPRDAQVFVARAYLATPSLVEREVPLARIQKRLANARAGRGRATVVQGDAGTGRSRFVDACVLQAKLAGMLTAVADAGDGHAGPYSATRVLASQIIDAMPELAARAARPHAEVLGHVVPELGHPDAPLVHFKDPRALRPAAQAALRAWLTAIAAEHPLLLAIDDVDLVDEPTSALLARLSADANKHALSIVVSANTRPQGNPVAMGLLASTAAYQTLAPLSDAGTQQLLASVFGDRPRLQLVATRVHAASAGKPRDIMQLAQHLVDARVVHLDGGAWTLPSQLSRQDLPDNATAAMATRAAGLDERSLLLSRLLALHGQALELEDFVDLFETHSASSVVQSLGELIEADVVRVAGNRYALNRPAWKQVLLGPLDDEALARMHGQLARLLERRDGDPIRLAQHLRWSGQTDAAIDHLVAFSHTSQGATAADPQGFVRLVEGLPDGWYELFDWAVQTAVAQGRPPAARYELQGRLAGILAVADPNLGAEHLLQHLTTLKEAVGLDLFDALPAEVQGMDRLKAALDGAQARFDGLPEGERLLSPLVAIRPLAQAVIPIAAVIVNTYDYDLLFQVPSLEPLHPLSPALQVVTLLMDGMTERMTGRLEASLTTYQRALDMANQPDHSGLDPTHAAHMRLGVIWGLGMVHATMGSARALEYVGALLADPWHRVSGILVQMLHAYWQADPERGDAIKDSWLLSRIEARSQQWFDGAHLIAEATAHATADDLSRLRDAMKDIEALALRAPGWRPAHRYARGEYHRIRGDASEALADFEAACDARPAGQHIIWAFAAAGQVRALIALGRANEAVERGHDLLAAGQAAGLGHLLRHIRTPLALAQAEAGGFSAGATTIDAVLAELEQEGLTGLLTALALDVRARIAVMRGELELASNCLERCRVHLNAAESAPGRRRCQQLHDHIHGRKSVDAAAERVREQVRLEAELRTAVSRCDTRADRAQAALELFLARVGASGGVLRLVTVDGMRECASCGLGDAQERVEALAESLYSEIAFGDDDTIATNTDTGDGPNELDIQIRSVVLKHENNGQEVITGVAILALSPGQTLRMPPEELAATLSRTLCG